MSDIHTMLTDKKLTNIDAIFHLTIPDETNNAGINFRVAILEYKPASSVIFGYATKFPDEWTDMQAGIIYEYTEKFVFDSALDTPAEKAAALRARYTVLSTLGINYIKAVLKYYGMTIDVT